MKKILENKKILIILAVVFILILATGCLFMFKNGDDDKGGTKKKVTNTSIMYVKINPLVKLTFQEEYFLCHDDLGNESICGNIDTSVLDYELLNDDAKDIYNDLEFKDKDIADVLLMLCDTARDNDIGFKSLEITTDNKNINDEDILNYIKENSKYETEYTIYVNFEEHIDDSKINDNFETITYKVTFDSNGGSKVDSREIKEGNKLEKPENPTRKNYTFVEWQLDGKKYNFNLEITKDITLKAKWKQNSETTYDKNNTSDNKNNDENKVEENNNTETKVENNKTDVKEEEKIPSTLDKVNLNDNILVSEWEYAGMLCGWYGFVTSNILEIIPDAKDYGYWYIDGDDYSKLSFDTTKENTAINELNKIKNSSLPWGVVNFKYSSDNHMLRYSYSTINLSDYGEYGSFGKAWYNEKISWENKLHKIFEDAEIFNTGCGDMAEPTLLTEDLCNKYNINCSRW